MTIAVFAEESENKQTALPDLEFIEFLGESIQVNQEDIDPISYQDLIEKNADAELMQERKAHDEK